MSGVSEEKQADAVGQLVDRYLRACESVYPAALSNSDIRLAAQIARSALSVVLNASSEIGPASAQPRAVVWFERLESLYRDGTPPPGDVSRTLNWASSAMISVFHQGETHSLEHKDEHRS